MKDSHSRIQEIGDRHGNPEWYEGETPFTYICSATSAPEVNLDPLLALGLNRLEQVILLIGASTVPTPVDIRNAIEPAGRLKDLIIRKCKKNQLAPVPIVEIRCPADGADAWYARLMNAMSQAPSDLLLLNLQGGTRAMIFSALSALQECAPEGGDKEGRALIFHSKPPRIEEIWPELGGSPILMHKLPHVSAEDILRVRGFNETDRDSRRQRTRAAVNRKDFTDTVFALIIGEKDPGLIRNRAGAMHKTVAPWLDENKASLPASLSLSRSQLKGPSQFWTGLQTAAATSGGLIIANGDGVRLKGRPAVSFLGGGWFEEWAYLRALEALGHQPFWDILMGVDFSYADKDGPDDGEIDLLIAGQGTSFLVECKAGAAEGNLDRDAIRKIASWRDRLAGTQGGAALLCLNTPKTDGTVKAMRSEAQALGIPLWFGPDGIAAYLDWLSELRRMS